MSILIKGMNLPKKGRVTVQIDVDGSVYQVIAFDLTAERYMSKYTVQEIPTPHGRLIDGDDLITAFPANEAGADVKIASVRGTILHAPTVIEEEEGEHD